MSQEDKARYRQYPRVDFSRAIATDPSKLTYKLFTKETHPDSFILLNEQTSFNGNLKTVLFLHGWTSSDRSHWYEPLKNAYLQQYDCNVIFVDWSAYSKMGYSVSSASVRPIGELIAVFLSKYPIPAENIHLIGHSLGSHLASFTAKAYEKLTGQKIGRLTGLDPAGPMWNHKNMSEEEKISPSDAHFVDVIHTDVQLYGYTHPCGHVDFYPHGGTNQPLPPDLEDVPTNHNHHRAPLLFVESLTTKIETSEIHFEEDDDYNIVIKHKENASKVVFGEHVSRDARGVFHFETHHSEPYLSKKF